MEVITQRESVYRAITKLANPETRVYSFTEVVSEVTQDFTNGVTEFKVTERNLQRLGDPLDLRKYVESLVKNWQKKDKRLAEYSPSDTGWVAKAKVEAPKPTKKSAKPSKVYKRPSVDLVEDVPL